MSVYVHDTAYHSRRALAFVAIVVVHALAIYAFATGLAKRAVQFVTAPLQTDIIQVEKPKDLPPPPPPVDLKERPPVQVVVPDINISVPVEVAPPITNITTTPVAPPRAPVVVPGTPITAQFSSAEDYYPDASKRANEEGRPIVHYCVGASNKVDSVQIGTSSGFPRLDDAAVNLVRAATRVKAATVEGKPIASCKDVAVKFQLKVAR